MKYWITDSGKTYWEGNNNQVPPGAQEVPKRPGPNMVWNGSAWIVDSALSKPFVLDLVLPELDRLLKFSTYSADVDIVAALASYIPQISTYLTANDPNVAFPTCPLALKDENFKF